LKKRRREVARALNHLLPGMQRMAPQRKKESLWRVFPLDFDGLIQGALKESMM
jgi:hypothetical protein